MPSHLEGHDSIVKFFPYETAEKLIINKAKKIENLKVIYCGNYGKLSAYFNFKKNSCQKHYYRGSSTYANIITAIFQNFPGTGCPINIATHSTLIFSFFISATAKSTL